VVHHDAHAGNVLVDAAGRLVASTDAAGNTTVFTYDAAGRMLQCESRP